MVKAAHILYPFLIVLSALTIGIAKPSSVYDSSFIPIAADIATVFALVAACWQLRQSTRQHRENARRNSAEKAIELAKLFQSEIVEKISVQTIALGLIGQNERYEKSENLHNCHLRFTKEEWEELFGKEAVQAYPEQRKKITHEILHLAKGDLNYLFSDSPKTFESEALKKLYDKAQQTTASVQFDKQCSNLLNTLEWIAMSINTHVASEETVYQSLHQMFLRYIRLEYPTIASYNSDFNATDQYYTNIILLYRRWEKKWQETNKKDQKLAEREKRRTQNQLAKHQKKRDANVNYPPQV